MAKVKREVRRFENIEVRHNGFRAKLDGEDERINIAQPQDYRLSYLYIIENHLSIKSDELDSLITALEKLKEEMEK